MTLGAYTGRNAVDYGEGTVVVQDAAGFAWSCKKTCDHTACNPFTPEKLKARA